ncbi:MAG: hypothetical protein ACLR0U_13480 [Enterocloster clostridioformis]
MKKPENTDIWHMRMISWDTGISVYQAGGYDTERVTRQRQGFPDYGTRKAMEFYIGLQKEPWCPDQNYFG